LGNLLKPERSKKRYFKNYFFRARARRVETKDWDVAMKMAQTENQSSRSYFLLDHWFNSMFQRSHIFESEIVFSVFIAQ